MISFGQKLEFISDVLEGLFFLFENNVVHLDMKLNNLLLNSNGRVIICDFGYAKALNPQKQAYLLPPKLASLGGNLEHLAPEIKSVNNTVAQWVDYSKQPSFELGMIAHEILFGRTPENVFGEEMDSQYFLSLSQNLPFHNNERLFDWLKGLLMKDKRKRSDLLGGRIVFQELIEEQRNKDFMEEFYPGVF